ncbi:MAG: TonB-dependent receptor [Terracidiphilus sp.]
MRRKTIYDTFIYLLVAYPALVLALFSPGIAHAASDEATPATDTAVGGSVLPTRLIPMVSTTLKVVATDSEIQNSLAPVTSVSQDEILSAAGTYGDFSRYLQLFPGVIGSSDLSNDVLVRGGHPTENLFVVDGVEVPNINHFSLSGSNGGFTSMIDSTAVGSMEIRDDVYDVGYASRLSSLIEIHTRELTDARQAGNLSIGIAGAGGLYQRALAHKGSFLLSAHRSILNLVTNDIGINGVPTYSNAMTRLVIDPNERDSFSFFSLSGSDSIQMTPCQVPAATSAFQTEYSGWRSTEAVNWRHNYTSRVTGDLTASSSLTRQKISQQQQYGAYLDSNGDCLSVSVTPAFTQDSEDGLSALNYELRADIHGWLVSAGLSGKLMTPDDSVAQPAGQLSPFSADATRSDADTFQRKFSTGQTAGFLGAEGGFGTRWKLLAGLRAESFALTGGYALDPRVSVAYQFNSRQNLHGSLNVASQLPPIMDMISYAGNRSLKPIQARQAALGMRLWQGSWGTLDAEAYQKNYRSEAVSTEYPALMLSNMVDTLGQEFVWLPLTSAGSAQSRGLEVALRAHWRSRLQGMVSASRSQSTYRALDGIRRPGNYDIPFVMNAMGNLRLPHGFQLDWRDSAASGRPYTPFDMADSMAQSRGIYDVTRINALRGPLYNRLDLEVERHFRIKMGVIDFHAGTENIMNRGNLMGYAWLDNFQTNCGCGNSANQPIAKVDQVGRYPVFSLRYEF